MDKFQKLLAQRAPMTAEEEWHQRIGWAWGNDVEGSSTIEDVEAAAIALSQEGS